MNISRTSRWGAVFSMLMILCLVVTAGCGAPTAESDLDRVKRDGILSVGNDTTYAPFEFVGSDNVPTGFDIDLVTAVADRLGLRAVIVTTAWDGIIPALQARKFELVISAMTINAERQKEVAFSIPYYRADMGIAFNRTLHTITGPADLVGLTVGAQVGTTGEESAKMIGGVTVKSYPDIQLAMSDLKLGRIDAVVNDYPVSAYYAKEFPALSVISTSSMAGVDLTQFYGIAMHLQDTELKVAIDKALKELVTDGTYDGIYRKWFGSDPSFHPGDMAESAF